MFLLICSARRRRPQNFAYGTESFNAEISACQKSNNVIIEVQVDIWPFLQCNSKELVTLRLRKKTIDIYNYFENGAAFTTALTSTK